MKKLFVVLLFALLLVTFASAAEISSFDKQKVHYFYSPTCSHCKNVADSGILDKVSLRNDSEVIKYNVMDVFGGSKFEELTKKLDLPQSVPLVVIERNSEYSYLLGDGPIIGDLEKSLDGYIPGEKLGFFDKIKKSLESKFIENTDSGKLTFVGVLILMLIALIDAINPCAFGVLIFLMAGLLSIGSAKRALKAGLIYSFVIGVEGRIRT